MRSWYSYLHYWSTAFWPPGLWHLENLLHRKNVLIPPSASTLYIFFSNCQSLYIQYFHSWSATCKVHHMVCGTAICRPFRVLYMSELTGKRNVRIKIKVIILASFTTYFLFHIYRGVLPSEFYCNLYRLN